MIGIILKTESFIDQSEHYSELESIGATMKRKREFTEPNLSSSQTVASLCDHLWLRLFHTQNSQMQFLQATLQRCTHYQNVIQNTSACLFFTSQLNTFTTLILLNSRLHQFSAFPTDAIGDYFNTRKPMRNFT